MPPTPLQHRRTHNTLLFQKLLNLRDGTSPFTLILDSLEAKAAQKILGEFMSRAKISKTKVIFLSYRTLRQPKLTDVFIKGHKFHLKDLRAEILSNIPAPTAATGNRTVIVIDTLNPLCNSSTTALPAFLSSLLGPTILLVGVYHTDVPGAFVASNVYNPHPLTTLTYLATSIITVHSLGQTIAKKGARDRSLQEPSFGIAEGQEGIVVGRSEPGGKPSRRNTDSRVEMLVDESEVVVEMEIRRKSGRGVREVFVLTPGTTSSAKVAGAAGGSVAGPASTKIMLLDDHPLYTPQRPASPSEDSMVTNDEVPFSLSLTEKQKKDREGIVLPYFDAQREGFVGSTGEGGRILYNMGREDDFDEEEDEI